MLRFTVGALCAVALSTLAGAAPVHPQGHSVSLSKHHSVGITTTQRLAATNGTNLPTGGNVWPVAIYWVEVGVGTPPVHFPVAIDSGSMTLDIQGPGCKNCPKFAPNAAYAPSKSSSAKKCTIATCGLRPTFSNTYQTCDLSNPTAPCTITGANYDDAVTLGGLGPVPVTFGAIETQTSNFDQFNNICGVMGLAGRAGKGNVFESLRKGGFIKQDVFGMCLAAGSKSNGTFTIGGLDSRLYSGDFAWAKNSGGEGLYTRIPPSRCVYEMPLSGLTVGGKKVACERKTAILDSGTNVLLVPTPIFKSYEALFTSMCEVGAKLHGVCDVKAGTGLFAGHCFDMTEAQIAAFPELGLGITASGLKMTGKNYLKRADPRAKTATEYCLGIRPTGPAGFLIIGDTTMENYYVAFDRAGERIGWAKRTDMCGSV